MGLNFIRKLFHSRKRIEDVYSPTSITPQHAVLAEAPAREAKGIDVDGEYNEDNPIPPNPTMENISVEEPEPTTTLEEAPLKVLHYQFPLPEDYGAYKEIFKDFLNKFSVSKLPVLWSTSPQIKFRDLTVMHNLLVIGGQASGKSNFVHQLILSVLFTKHPLTVKFIIADSKRIDYTAYEKIAHNFFTHLQGETDFLTQKPISLIARINSLCIEMDNRYDLLVQSKSKHIEEYNQKFQRGDFTRYPNFPYLPLLVLIIDDFGQYISQLATELFQPYIRILGEGYKVGIFSIMVTSQTSSKLLPNEILSLIASRVVFRMHTKEDYRKFFDTTRLDIPYEPGIFLYKESRTIQIGQALPFNREATDQVVESISTQRIFPNMYSMPDFLNASRQEIQYDVNVRDIFLFDAARLIVLAQSGSSSLLQRRMKLGYNRAGLLMDQLEAIGIVGPNQGSKVRDVLVKTEKELEQILKKLI